MIPKTKQEIDKAVRYLKSLPQCRNVPRKQLEDSVIQHWADYEADVESGKIPRQ